jgi:hypothetical protein
VDEINKPLLVRFNQKKVKDATENITREPNLGFILLSTAKYLFKPFLGRSSSDSVWERCALYLAPQDEPKRVEALVSKSQSSTSKPEDQVYRLTTLSKSQLSTFTRKTRSSSYQAPAATPKQLAQTVYDLSSSEGVIAEQSAEGAQKPPIPPTKGPMTLLDWDMPLRKLLGAVEITTSQSAIKYSGCIPEPLQTAEFMSIDENFGGAQVGSSISGQVLESECQGSLTYICSNFDVKRHRFNIQHFQFIRIGTIFS